MLKIKHHILIKKEKIEHDVNFIHKHVITKMKNR